jgi:hypothetical protein
MILFNLKCSAGHEFEAWFRNGDAYEGRKPGSVRCPVCDSAEVAKAPMAPRIARTKADAPAEISTQAEVISRLRALRQAVEERCDYVGERFAETAREIHYGEIEARAIYGEASPEQARELKEEGISFHPLPWLPRTNS